MALEWTAESIWRSGAYFPLLIQYTTDGSIAVVQQPNDILIGQPFIILECHTQQKDR